jgi:hypothetical protein
MTGGRRDHDKVEALRNWADVIVVMAHVYVCMAQKPPACKTAGYHHESCTAVFPGSGFTGRTGRCKHKWAKIVKRSGKRKKNQVTVLFPGVCQWVSDLWPAGWISPPASKCVTRDKPETLASWRASYAGATAATSTLTRWASAHLTMCQSNSEQNFKLKMPHRAQKKIWPFWPMVFWHRPLPLWPGTSDGYWPYPLALWHVMAKLNEIVQYCTI